MAHTLREERNNKEASGDDGEEEKILFIFEILSIKPPSTWLCRVPGCFRLSKLLAAFGASGL